MGALTGAARIGGNLYHREICTIRQMGHVGRTVMSGSDFIGSGSSLVGAKVGGAVTALQLSGYWRFL